MRVHELKVATMHFPALRSGQKRFEFRLDDRGFEVGDYLLLRELNEFMVLTGCWVLVGVTYILTDSWYSMPKKYVCMSLTDPMASGETPDGFEAYRPHILPVQQ